MNIWIAEVVLKEDPIACTAGVYTSLEDGLNALRMWVIDNGGGQVSFISEDIDTKLFRYVVQLNNGCVLNVTFEAWVANENFPDGF